MNRAILLAVVSLWLTACGSDKAAEGTVEAGRSAEGEVLGGTISDDMLPLDTLKSQSPPLKVESTNAAVDDAASASTADAANEELADEPAEPVATESPAENAEEGDES